MRWTRNRYCVVCSAVFFIHFLLKRRGSFFFLSFSSLVFLLLFVRLFVYSLLGVVLFALHVLLYHIHEQTLFISSAFIKRDFLLRSNRLIDYFFSLCFRFPLLRSTVALVVSVPSISAFSNAATKATSSRSSFSFSIISSKVSFFPCSSSFEGNQLPGEVEENAFGENP